MKHGLIRREDAIKVLTEMAVAAPSKQTRAFARCVNAIEMIPVVEGEFNRLGETYRQLKKSLQDRGFEDLGGLFEAYEKLKSGVPLPKVPKEGK